MYDLGTLGGTIGVPGALNNRGQVAGGSNLRGDQSVHPFLWDRGVLKDLGTLGGTNGSANAMNEEGVVVGLAQLKGDTHFDAFLWDGRMHDLGNFGCRSQAFGINSRRQVVGTSFLEDCQTILPVLWENGKKYNLNDLIPPAPNFQLLAASYINEDGVIAGIAFLAVCNDPDGCVHAFLLFPCDDWSPCKNQLQTDTADSASLPAEPSLAPPVSKSTQANQSRQQQMLMQRSRIARWPHVVDF
jgi:probable HAF family extracellular repeat protein